MNSQNGYRTAPLVLLISPGWLPPDLVRPDQWDKNGAQ